MKSPFAIITGAAKGIGLALVRQCLQRNIKVIAVDVDNIALAQAKQTIASTTNLETFTVDLAKQNQIASFATTILEKYGVPTYLFNNAGIGGEMLPIWEQDLEKLKQIMDINFFSAVYLTKIFLPTMIEQKSKGFIVNTASMASFYTAPLISSYVISKHSMMAFSECLYHDLRTIHSDIQVSVVCPGGVKTTILDEHLQTVGQYEAMMNQLNTQSKHFMIKFAKLIKKGMSTDTVAEIIFAGIEENQFYIFTHPDMLKIVQHRLDAVLHRSAPQSLEI